MNKPYAAAEAVGPFPLAWVRSQFPALSLTDDGVPRTYLDNPAGTQVPLRVVERMRQALIESNANFGGYFATTRQAEALYAATHEALAAFLNAASAREVVLGANMTTLTLAFSRGLVRRFAAGDEIVLSRMDHDANVAPWLLAAEERGLTVRWMDFDPESFEFPADALGRVLSPRTRLVAFGYASNILGTVNPVRAFAAEARAAGALTYIDAVHYAPHGPLDVQALGCDFLVCSAYKFFGPHVGVLWGREELLNETFAYKVRPAGERAPDRFETGTPNLSGLAGTLGALEYLAALGAGEGVAPTRQALLAAMMAAQAYEARLGLRLLEGLEQLPGLRVQGVTERGALDRRCPTLSVTVAGRHPRELAQGLAAEGVFSWDGHSYGLEPVRRLGLEESGGVLRLGLAHYNDEGDVERTLAVLGRLLRQ